MQVKLFTIPILGGDEENDVMNAFLRSKKVIGIDKAFVDQGSMSYWTFCVKYIEHKNAPKPSKKNKVDYRAILSEEEFGRYASYRLIRKTIAEEENIPLYAIFTNEELAQMAKVKDLNQKSMLDIPGIGEKKTQKFGARFIESISNNEKTQS